MLLAGFYAGSIFALAGQEPATPSQSAGSPALPVNPSPSTERTVNSSRAAMIYLRTWGIDDLTLRATASGAAIRFSYRIVDARKASVLNDKKLEPYLVVEKNGATLSVPAAEKVGKLRQTATPENGREYWMVFQNASHMVLPGDHVDIVIGSFHANGLVVEPSVMEVATGR